MTDRVGTGVTREQPVDGSEFTGHELLTRIDGIGPDTANRLLTHFGSGRKVAQSACRYWGELVEVNGITEETAREMFDKIHEADVFHDLRGY